MKAIFTFFLIVLPGFCSAGDLPALFNVTGVASVDVLNVRSRPKASSGVIGSIPHDQTDIEVTALNAKGTWGRVNVQENSGWVAMRFLEAQATGDYLLSQNLRCFGTEPFWSVDITQGNASSYTQMGSPPVSLTSGLLNLAAGRRDAFFVQSTGTDGSDVTAIMRRNPNCSDGMSEQVYGLDGMVLIRDADGQRLLSGCCTLSR